jgi:hypothetical protein
MKQFDAPLPSFPTEDVKPLRTRDAKALAAAMGTLTAPLSPAMSAELIAIGYVHEDAAVRKQAMALVTKHVKDAATFKTAYKTLTNVGQHVAAERIRKLEHPLRLDIAKAVLFHGKIAGGVPFEEDAQTRGALLDTAVARAKREEESEVELGSIYWSWNEHGGWATDMDITELPGALFEELAARRKEHPFTGVSFHGTDLSDVPAELAQAAPWLTSLVLAHNPLAELPAVLWKLTNLETLNVLGTELSDIPADLAKLTKLRSRWPMSRW